MQLDFAFLAQYADCVSDGRMTIFGAGIDGIETSALPFESQPISLVAKFLIEPGDQDRRHFYRIEITSPSGERKAMCADEELNTAPDAYITQPAGSNLIAKLNIQFRNTGKYQLHLMLDGREVKQIPITVSLVELPPQSTPEREEVANG